MPLIELFFVFITVWWNFRPIFLKTVWQLKANRLCLVHFHTSKMKSICSNHYHVMTIREYIYTVLGTTTFIRGMKINVM